MCMPPSTTSVLPVTYELSELARYSTERAISSGQAWRASGMRASKRRAARSGGAPVADVSIARWKSVLVGRDAGC